MSKPPTKSFGLDFKELPNVIKRIQIRFAEIKQKFPKISAYLMFAKAGDQVSIKAASVAILESFPGFFANSSKKESALQQLAQRNQILKALKSDSSTEKKDRKRLESIEQDLQSSIESLEIEFSAQVELRFDELDYDIIRELRSDDLVDRDLTPQIGGIRIVLGTIYDFSEGWTDS